MTKINRRIKIYLSSAFVLAILLFSASLLILKNSDHTSRTILKEKADIIAAAINLEYLAQLNGYNNDLYLPAYAKLKDQLYNIRCSDSAYKFLYIMGQTPEGEIFFFIDSQRPESPDFVSPGTIYKEISEEYLNAFEKEIKITVGPVTDRWGTMITALIPIKHPISGELMGVLGLDVLDNNWQSTIISRSLPIIVLMYLILFVFVGIVIFREYSRNYRFKRYGDRKIRGSKSSFS